MIDYAYLNARISIFAGRLLSETRLTELLNQPSSQGEDLLNDTTIDQNLIEQAWLMRMLADFQVLVRPLSGAPRELLMYWFHKWDIANLKTIVRGKIAGLKAEAISAQLLELGQLSALPIEQLLRTEDIGELLRRLEKSPYGNIARQARHLFEKDHQLYSLDAAIDRHYLLGFVQRIRVLDSKQRQHLSSLVSIMMDRFNLLWLLRYRFAYNLSAAETYYLLVPTPYLLNRNRLQRLVELNSLEEVLAHLPEPFYSLLLETDNTFSVDQRLTMKMQQLAELTLKLQSFTLAKVFAYILLREMEMRRVMAILKGKNLNLNKNIILSAASR
ncbi:h+transporting two sector atpase c subunit [Candidatus Thiomargarita nelsonii]|uniref:H+transporting two sector atpase c subunit n=1 Tax=Candidatus Thiomargarita nelsonii TaxID=1003181 RepID=A0A0A6NZ60_9GAMM|nr:h+transporting two sector atpase c subunit [Candidatus Thiomargarita nelsonii]